MYSVSGLDHLTERGTIVDDRTSAYLPAVDILKLLARGCGLLLPLYCRYLLYSPSLIQFDASAQAVDGAGSIKFSVSAMCMVWQRHS